MHAGDSDSTVLLLCWTSIMEQPGRVPLSAESAHGEHKGSTAELEASRASHMSERCKHESSRPAMGSRAAGIGQAEPRAPQAAP